jgi:hypothetical protein
MTDGYHSHLLAGGLDELGVHDDNDVGPVRLELTLACS